MRITVHNKTFPLLICLLAMSLTACNRSLPKLPDVPKLTIYKIDIAQGNIVEADQIAKLAVGMAQKHVQVLLGTPLIRDPFQPQRWDYIYNFQPGGEARQQRQVTLFFDDQQLLSRIAGDVIGQLRSTPLQVSRAKTTIQVPAREIIEDVGFWRGLRSRVPLIGDKPAEEQANTSATVISDPVTTPVASAAQNQNQAQTQTTPLPARISAIPQSLDQQRPPEPAVMPTTAQVAATTNSTALQPGMSLSELNNPDANQPQQATQPVPLDDDSGLFDGLLRKIGGG